MAFMCSGKKCSVVSVAFFVTLLAALGFVWFGTGAFFGKGEIENNLQRLSMQLTDIGSSYGKEIRITHGAIDVQGWTLNKKAVVRDVNIEIAGKANELLKFKFSMGDVLISSDPYNAQKLIIEISKTINIYQGDKIINTLALSEPLIYNYLPIAIDGAQSFQHNIIFPKKILAFGPKGDVIAESTTDNSKDLGDEKLSLSFAENPTLEFVATDREDVNLFSYDFSGLIASTQGKNIIAFGTLKSQFNEEEGDEEGRRAGKYTFMADDIVLYNEENFTKPYTINVNTNIIVDAAKGEPAKIATPSDIKNPINIASNDTRDREVKLNNITLSNPDFKIQVTGNFANTKGDPLPSGEINIDIDDLPKFLDSELVALQGREPIENGLAKIIGKPVAGEEQASFLLKREKNGVFYIGQTTFEELVTSVLSGSFMKNSSGVTRYPEPDTSTRIPTIEPGVSLPSVGDGTIDLPMTVPNTAPKP